MGPTYGGAAVGGGIASRAGMRKNAPNEETHPAFGEALRAAAQAGVRILARDCIVTEDTMTIDREVPVWL